MLRLLALANHVILGRWNLAATSLFVVRSQYASCLRYLNYELLGSHSGLIRLLALANHHRLGPWNLEVAPLFVVLSHYA